MSVKVKVNKEGLLKLEKQSLILAYNKIINKVNESLSEDEFKSINLRIDNENSAPFLLFTSSNNPVLNDKVQTLIKNLS